MNVSNGTKRITRSVHIYATEAIPVIGVTLLGIVFIDAMMLTIQEEQNFLNFFPKSINSSGFSTFKYLTDLSKQVWNSSALNESDVLKELTALKANIDQSSYALNSSRQLLAAVSNTELRGNSSALIQLQMLTFSE